MTNVPFGRSTAMRAQCAYGASHFQSGPVTIDRVSLRLDGGASTSGKQVEFELRMSVMPQDIPAMRADFAGNRGAQEVIVLNRAIRTLPQISSASGPAPFLLTLPLDTAFLYDPAQGPLLLEWVVFGQQPGSFPLDATYLCASSHMPIGPPACTPQGGPQAGQGLRLFSTTNAILWGRPFIVRIEGARPMTLTSLTVTLAATGTWNGLALPVDLSFIGAPGCFVSTPVQASILQVADVLGVVDHRFVLPADPALLGSGTAFQAAALDLEANALGIVTSQAFETTVCGFENVARVYAGGLTSASGIVETGVAPILELGLR